MIRIAGLMITYIFILNIALVGLLVKTAYQSFPAFWGTLAVFILLLFFGLLYAAIKQGQQFVQEQKGWGHDAIKGNALTNKDFEKTLEKLKNSARRK